MILVCSRIVCEGRGWRRALWSRGCPVYAEYTVINKVCNDYVMKRRISIEKNEVMFQVLCSCSVVTCSLFSRHSPEESEKRGGDGQWCL